MFDMGVKSVRLARINRISPLYLSFPVQNYWKISVKNEGKEFSFFRKGQNRISIKLF